MLLISVSGSSTQRKIPYFSVLERLTHEYFGGNISQNNHVFVSKTIVPNSPVIRCSALEETKPSIWPSSRPGQMPDMLRISSSVEQCSCRTVDTYWFRQKVILVKAELSKGSLSSISPISSWMKKKMPNRYYFAMSTSSQTSCQEFNFH